MESTTPISFNIVIHMEEEFDWDKGFFKANNEISHGDELIAFCEQLLTFQCKLIFAMDYAFVQSEDGKKVIEHFKDHAPHQVEFAAHLHPWVNPPFESEGEVPECRSYPGNLKEIEEYEKLDALTQLINERTGQQPQKYLAGRYGVGPNTYKVLSQLGYQTDFSISPFTDFSHQEGPDFSDYTNDTIEIDGIKCIPHTAGFVSHSETLSDYLNKDPSHIKRLNNSLLGKLFLKVLGVKKVRLSPEFCSLSELKKLTTSLLNNGVTNLVFYFHSPSVKAGLISYVQTEADLQQFKDKCNAYLTWALTNNVNVNIEQKGSI